MKRFLLIFVILAALALAAYFYFMDSGETEEILVQPVRGEFISKVIVTGELRAKNSIDIRGPSNARAIGVWEMTITNLVEEGTQVTEGQFVAELDKSEVQEKINDINLTIQKTETEFRQAQLDSSLTLSNARDELENLKYSLEEKQLVMEQSQYEAPSIKRQAKIDYEKTERSYEQAKKNYKTKVKQAIAKLSQIATDLIKDRQNLSKHKEALSEFTIKAPANGMVIYSKEWGGRKKVVGSRISAWNPIVANLPDLSEMESVTYVNEIDIQKIKENQFVNISLDANPDKRLSGKVEKVANIGETREGTDSKVFEVIIKVNEKDTTLLPSMTTSNEIIISKYSDVMSVPLESVHTLELKNKEKINYVIKKSGQSYVKQQVTLGEMNSDRVIIEGGLSLEDNILLSLPENEADFEMVYLEGFDLEAKKNIQEDTLSIGEPEPEMPTELDSSKKVNREAILETLKDELK